MPLPFLEAMSQLTLVGRSSSHFTRTTRLFALELGIRHDFRPVLDMTLLEPGNYAQNPALKVPILIDQHGPLYGTENICRELTRRSGRAEVVMRGDVSVRLVANAEELILSAMSAEVSLITAKVAGAAAPPKVLRSIENSLTFLNENVDSVLSLLPVARALSFLEVTLFCLVKHLPFRQVMPVDAWPRLVAFSESFGGRASARATEYRFDAAP